MKWPWHTHKWGKWELETENNANIKDEKGNVQKQLRIIIQKRQCKECMLKQFHSERVTIGSIYD